jgi:hypothetical protein
MVTNSTDPNVNTALGTVQYQDDLDISETSTALQSYQQQSRRRRKVFGVSIDGNNNVNSETTTTSTLISTTTTNAISTEQSIKLAFQDILTLATPINKRHDDESCNDVVEADVDKLFQQESSQDDTTLNEVEGDNENKDNVNVNVANDIGEEDETSSMEHVESLVEADVDKLFQQETSQGDNNLNEVEGDKANNDYVDVNLANVIGERDESSLKENVESLKECIDSSNNNIDISCNHQSNDHSEKEAIDLNSKPSTPQQSHVMSQNDEANEVTFANESDLDEEAVLQSTEYLFSTVTDKLSVTVKDIVESLCAEYNVKKLGKALKSSVRQKLIELIEEEQNAETNEQDGNDEDTADEQNDQEDEESSEQEGNDTDDDDAVEIVDDDDFDPVAERRKLKRTKSKRMKMNTKRHQESDSGDDDEKHTDSVSKNRKPRKINMKVKKSALRIHHEQLRKRRLDELRVRNEELQALASKQDQERAELIAAKFDTNRVEMRMQRLENRLDLLQKLDQQRIKCVTATPTSLGAKCSTTTNNEIQSTMFTEKSGGEDVETSLTAANETSDVESRLDQESDNNSDDEEEDDDDDDDMELVLVDNNGNEHNPSIKDTKQNPVKDCNHILSILDLADQEKLKPNSIGSQKQRCSPRRSVNARAQLRQLLLSKQRLMGNEWLARELGYKSQEDHLRDCQDAEQKKREIIIKREEIRVKENERRLLRERMLKLEQQQNEIVIGANNDDDDDPEYTPGDENNDANTNVDNSIDDDEDDEELELARIITDEQKTKDNKSDDLNENSEESSSVDKTDSVEHLEDLIDMERHNAIEEIPTNQKHLESVLLSNNISADTFTVAEVVHTENVCTATVSDDEMQTFRHDSNDGDFVNDSSIVEQNSKPLDNDDNQESDLVDTSSVADSSAEIEQDVEDEQANNDEKKTSKAKGVRNSAWRAMLEKEKEQERKKKRNGLVEEEAEEEEEEQVAGLEDFGFTINKKRKDDDGDDADDLSVDEDDMKHVVDDLSDDEGDEEAGEVARKAMEKKEEKERHKEMIRRLRNGYDGRRGGIAAATGARGIHRFDQLVAADNKEDAKRLGLANDEDFDSDSEEEGKEGDDDVDDEDDEAALIDKLLKDRFLHRNNNDDTEQENFSEDDDDDNENGDNNEHNNGEPVDEEEKEQERLAKRFAKRARMQRLLEAHENEKEFSQMKLIEEDTSFKIELQMMRVSTFSNSLILFSSILFSPDPFKSFYFQFLFYLKNGLARKRSTSSSQSRTSSNGRIPLTSSFSNNSYICSDENSNPNKRICIDNSNTDNTGNSSSGNQQTLTSSIFTKGGCLALALQNNRTKMNSRTSFVRTVSTTSGTLSNSNNNNSSNAISNGPSSHDATSSSYLKSIAFNHVVFTSISDNSNSHRSRSQSQSNSSSRMVIPPPQQRQAFSSIHQQQQTKFLPTKSVPSRESLFARSTVYGFHKRKR